MMVSLSGDCMFNNKPQWETFMGIQIALAYSAETEQELLRMGFTKTEVYVKSPPVASPVPDGVTRTEHEKNLGDAEFFSMKNPPYQFATFTYWGAGVS